MTYQNGSHACKQGSRLLRIESDLAGGEAARRERHEEIRDTLGKLQAELASFQNNSCQELATMRQDFDRRFRAVFSRLDALFKIAGV